ncbi:metalloregulator ArsR/SmtB family transcription factor [Acinetobacter sp. BSP-28]|uniref:metalloregulator ArsR/SmtB family transcription factor n=1 Tax=Acinetobacter sp. BSP-28 TaxID=3344661 RepID=UPI0037703EF7
MNTTPLKARIDFAQVDLVSDCLKVLSNSDRLKILCVLVDGELNVQQIELRTDIHQPTLSQQLTVLRSSQIVSTRREGKQIFYQLSDMRVLKIMQTLYEVYCSHD